MDAPYKEKVVLVTGAARGIGLAVAEAFVMHHATVILADVLEEQGLKEVRRLSELGKAFFFKTDVSNPQDIEELFSTIKSRFGYLDILVNNAGINKWESPQELAVQDWDRVINTNLRGTFLCTRHSVPLMRSGAVVNIASTRALMSEPDSEAYAASKGGILALTHSMAVSLSDQKITVNAISPGWIQTTDYDQLNPNDHQQHLSGRVGTVDDIARACLFLTHPENNFINGENLIIDGGMTRKMIYE